MSADLDDEFSAWLDAAEHSLLILKACEGYNRWLARAALFAAYKAGAERTSKSADLHLAGRDDRFGSQVWLNFDSKEFGDWFAKQVRIHGGISRWLPR